MEFQSDKSDLVFGILSVPLRQRCRRENIRKNILVDAVSEVLRNSYILSTLSGDVMSKDKSLKTTQMILACLARISIHFPSKICFQEGTIKHTKHF